MMTIEMKRKRYIYLCMCMQSGVAFSDTTDQQGEHLRVGVNVMACDHGALVAMLIQKNLITEDEYLDALIQSMEREVRSYEEKLSAQRGVVVKLGPAGFGSDPN